MEIGPIQGQSKVEAPHRSTPRGRYCVQRDKLPYTAGVSPSMPGAEQASNFHLHYLTLRQFIRASMDRVISLLTVNGLCKSAGTYIRWSRASIPLVLPFSLVPSPFCFRFTKAERLDNGLAGSLWPGTSQDYKINYIKGSAAEVENDISLVKVTATNANPLSCFRHEAPRLLSGSTTFARLPVGPIFDLTGRYACA